VLACFIEHQSASTEFGVQAVEKPQKSPTFGKIEHQNQGDADG